MAQRLPRVPAGGASCAAWGLDVPSPSPHPNSPLVLPSHGRPARFLRGSILHAVRHSSPSPPASGARLTRPRARSVEYFDYEEINEYHTSVYSSQHL